MNSIKVAEDLRKIYAPVFEVTLHLSVPEESDSSESSTENCHESEKSSEESELFEEDEASKNEVGCVVKRSSEDLPIMKKPKKASSNFDGILSGKRKETIRNEGKCPNSWKRQMRDNYSSLYMVRD